MPTYDYRCEDCNESFEIKQSMSDAKLESCPKCKGEKFKRLVGKGAHIQFKGTGFYETDYKRNGNE